MIMTEKLPHL